MHTGGLAEREARNGTVVRDAGTTDSVGSLCPRFRVVRTQTATHTNVC